MSNKARRVANTPLNEAVDAATSTATDRRDHKRHVTIFRLARLTLDGVDTVGIVRDISEGGMRLETMLAAEEGQDIVVSLFNDRYLTARVVWREGAVAGLQFERPVDVAEVLAKPAPVRRGQRPRRPRIPVDAPAVVRHGGAYVPARMCDLSQHGAKLRLDRELPDGAEITLHLGPLGAQRAHILWQSGDHVGLMFQTPLPMRDLVAWTASLAEKVRR